MSSEGSFERSLSFGLGLKHGFCLAVANSNTKIDETLALNKAIEDHYANFIEDPNQLKSYQLRAQYRHKGEVQGANIGKYVRDRLEMFR